MASGHQERVRTRAYELWQASGSDHGRDMEHWLRAEEEIASAAKRPVGAAPKAKQAKAAQPKAAGAERAAPKKPAPKAAPAGPRGRRPGASA